MPCELSKIPYQLIEVISFKKKKKSRCGYAPTSGKKRHKGLPGVELSWYLCRGNWLYLLVLHNLLSGEKSNFPSVPRLVLGADREEVSAFCERENHQHPFCSLRRDLDGLLILKREGGF